MGAAVVRAATDITFNKVVGGGQDVGFQLFQGHEGALTVAAFEGIPLEVLLQMLSEGECFLIASTAVEALVRCLFSPTAALCGFIRESSGILLVVFQLLGAWNQLPSTLVLASAGSVQTLPLQAGVHSKVLGHVLDGRERHIAPSAHVKVLTPLPARGVAPCLGHPTPARFQTHGVSSIVPDVSNLIATIIPCHILVVRRALLAGAAMCSESFVGSFFQLHAETLSTTAASFIITSLPVSWCVCR